MASFATSAVVAHTNGDMLPRQSWVTQPRVHYLVIVPSEEAAKKYKEDAEIALQGTIAVPTPSIVIANYEQWENVQQLGLGWMPRRLGREASTITEEQLLEAILEGPLHNGIRECERRRCHATNDALGPMITRLGVHCIEEEIFMTWVDCDDFPRASTGVVWVVVGEHRVPDEGFIALCRIDGEDYQEMVRVWLMQHVPRLPSLNNYDF